MLTILPMKKKLPVILILIVLIMSACSTKQKADSPYAEQIDSLMSLMTIEEKIGQLNLPSAGDITTGLAQSSGIIPKIKNGQVGGLLNIRSVEKIRATQRIAVEESRMKIPLIFGMDVIHGYKTIFPLPIALSCTWDMELIENVARVAALEATADGIMWNFSPMVDLSRDPRWGRVAEGIGEDPFLGYEISRAMVQGYQGEDLSLNNTMMSCVKHFALYGASEAGRDYNTVDMSRIRMFNEYFPPYKGAVDAGVGSVMAAFNEVDGIPATGNRWLLTEVLRDRWNFDGFVVSDYTGVTEMIYHGMGDTAMVSALALKAGLDMDMISEGYVNTLKKSMDEGVVLEELIDQSCRRILEAKYKLGLFDDPYRYCDNKRSETEIFTEENRNFAREVASESIVLLKNENNLLPLEKNVRIALIGPMADNVENMVGTWSVAGDFKQSISLLQGLTNVGGERVKVFKARGANVVRDPDLEKRVSVFGKPTYRDERSESELIGEAVNIASRSDVIIAAVGESAEMSGECSSRTDIGLPENQLDLLKELQETGKPIVLVLFSGRPLGIQWESENIPAILNVWFTGTEAGNAIADVIFGDVNPSAKLTMTFPKNVGQVPIFYNYKNTGRPLKKGNWFEKFKSNYLDVSNEPLYPFGFGLSYSNFEYGKISTSSTEMTGDQTLIVSVNVTNTGTKSGKEVVQLYVRDLVGTVTRPVKELKAFKKIEIDTGESVVVDFELTTKDLMFYNYDLEYVWEAGEFDIMVGPNSEDLQSVRINWNK